MTPESVDKIIHAVEHWADDIDDPVVRTLTIELNAAVDEIMRAWAEANKKQFPQGVPEGKAKFSIRIGDDKINWNSVW